MSKTETYDLIVRGGVCVTPNGREQCDIGIRDGRFCALGDLSAAQAKETLDAKGLHVLPGVIDSQVHFREPGLTQKEDLESGTRGAALGGVTAIFEMPNTKPPTDTSAQLEEKLQRAKKSAWTDHAFFVGATPNNAAALRELELHPGCSGVKIFMGSSTGTLLVDQDAALERVLRSGYRRVAVHCEDEARLIERKGILEGAHDDPSKHPEWRDVETALRATQRLIRAARKTHRLVHVLHVTTADEMRFLAEHKDIATVECTPQHLTLEAPDCYERLGTFAQMNPPIRTREHREALWEALRSGIVDVLGSDHAPHTREEKARPYPASPSGMPGVQTLVPIMLNHVHEGRLTLERFVDLTSAGPARLFGIASKGRIALGYDADLTVVDLAQSWTIEDKWMATKSGWTPFAGMQVTGRPLSTIIRGQIVMRDGELQGEPCGEPVRFGALGHATA